MIDYQIQTLDEVREEIGPLLKDHYEEVAMYQDHIDLDVDWARYDAIEENGSLAIFTMREDGDLVGYNVFFINFHPHYQNTCYAVNDIVYIHPALRGSEKTPTFFKRCEEWLKEKWGIQVITYHMKESKPFHGLMNFLEFDHAEHTYSKYVG